MGYFPLNYSKEEFEELQEAFKVLCEELIKIAKRNMVLKDSLKKVSLEKEADNSCCYFALV